MYVHLPDSQIVADVEIRKTKGIKSDKTSYYDVNTLQHRCKSKSRCQTGEYNNKVTMLLPFPRTFNKCCVHY